VNIGLATLRRIVQNEGMVKGNFSTIEEIGVRFQKASDE
jgi:hypothetical protein